jgi:phosphatidate phosphatase PAH1
MFKKNKDERVENYKKILNKKDSFDAQILKLIKNKELTIGFVETKGPNNNNIFNTNLDPLSKSKRVYLIKKRKPLKSNIKQ